MPCFSGQVAQNSGLYGETGDLVEIARLGSSRLKGRGVGFTSSRVCPDVDADLDGIQDTARLRCRWWQQVD